MPLDASRFHDSALKAGHILPKLRVPVALVIAVSLIVSTRTNAASDAWSEVKSPHFTVWSNASDSATRTLVWQLEQIRGAMAALFPWAKVDLAKPLLVLAVKDEQSMKALAPKYWEQKGGVRPVSVWNTGSDRHYMAIRADLRGDDTDTVNPYTSAYFMYTHLILASSFNRDLPLWFSRGLAGVLSNTIVRDNYILLGPPIPWHLEELRQQRFLLKQLLSMTRSSPELQRDDGLRRFDAQSWAFVHMLMFGETGKYQAGINRFSSQLLAGKDATAAFSETIGRVEDLQTPFALYITSSIYSYQKANLDAGVSRERFQTRSLTQAESSGGRAAFHVAMDRPAEARALIDEARKLDPKAPAAYVAEGLLLDENGKRDEAAAAYAKAAELGSSSDYAFYRAAILKWPSGSDPDQDTLQQMEKNLARAVELNPSFAAALASLAEVRAALRRPFADAVGLVTRAVQLEPSDPWHRMSAARVFWRFDQLEDARKAAEIAVKLADSDAARQGAQEILSSVVKASAAAAAPRAGSVTGASSADPNALVASCQHGDSDACRAVAPIADKACSAGQGRACLIVAVLQARGQGVPKDEARAFAAFERLCDGGLLESCAQWAVALASHPQKPDIPKARELLTKSCGGGLAEACEMLKSLPKH